MMNHKLKNQKQTDEIKQEEQATENEIENTTPKTYKIVGIIERPSLAIEPYEVDWFTVITKCKM